MSMQILLTATDHILEVSGLTNGLTGAVIADAEIAVTLRDAQGDTISGATWPITALAVTGIAGSYRALLPATLEVTPRMQIEATIVADAGPGLQRTWYMPLRVERYPCAG
jgi:hypothetical protein